MNGREQNAAPGNRIALSFDPNTPFFPSQSDLENTLRAGINLIEFSDPTYFSTRSIDDFFILVSTSDRYVTMDQFETEMADYLESTLSKYRAFDNIYSDKLAGLKLFHFPDDFSPSFKNLSENYIDLLSEEVNLPLYYQSSKLMIEPGEISPYRFVSTYYTESDEITSMQNRVIYFEPGTDDFSTLKRLEELLKQSVEFNDSIIIIPSDWFYERLRVQPDLQLVFKNYTQGNLIPFPYPKIESQIPDINVAVLILLIIWVLFICLYKYRSNFPDSLYRYFLNHSFFASDTMENRNRNFSDAFTILLLHVLIVALFFYTFSSQIFSHNGLEALSHNFPLLLISGNELLSFFVLGLIASIFSHVISIFWIYLFNKSMNRIGQAIQLYAWGLSLNLIIVTLLVTLSFWNANTIWIYSLSALFLIVWIMSFNTASIDGARSLERNRILNILLTFGLHTVLIIGLILLLFMNPETYEPLKLAFQLR
tara:strand:+ start:39336 stop:40778 length:1443 start_codon:yes stop_codon:yes gene_type:complete